MGRSIQSEASQFYREYNLVQARSSNHLLKEPAQHQKLALEKLLQWFDGAKSQPRGGLLVLPTGGGKTFTCVHFLCRQPISDGYKVLWLAHTHHLLEQALNTFDGLLHLVAEPRSTLSIRVVSGASQHFGIRDIQGSDDVVLASLQTICKALNDGHKSLDEFLESAGGNLFVVFDEAHHSPAPSYRRLLQNLRTKCETLGLLGLTATPTYGDEKKRGWLSRLFPQGIVHQETPQRLMAKRVLAKPVVEEARTKFEPDFSDREYQKWLGTNRDIPEEIIKDLAENRARNEFIVQHYMHNRERYGKTLIFADRWAQCEVLCTLFARQGVKAGAVYSHVVLGPGSAEERNRRAPGENVRVLEEFRRGELDVLVNIKMLTEGTDVPDVQTVFLTRQTTSQILLTQMVGRALRARKFGGTEKAYIVSFIDDWKHRINWAAYDQIGAGRADDSDVEYGKRPPISLISIDLIRRLARQMDSGKNISPEPYRSFLPLGWYLVDFDAVVEGSDDIEPVRQLVLAYEHDKPGFDDFICTLKGENLDEFADVSATLDGQMESRLAAWKEKHFGSSENRLGTGLLNDMLSIVRHVAQNEMEPPKFFPFEKRDEHDLDILARAFLDRPLSAMEKRQALNAEYKREDQYWTAIYPEFRSFNSDFEACQSRICEALENNRNPENYEPDLTYKTVAPPPREPDEEVKDQVKSRDGFRCRCCQCSERRWLQVDHIQSWFHQGGNQFSNLQTLCKKCNRIKGTETINFLLNQSDLGAAPIQLPAIPLPEDEHVREPEHWEIFLRRWINFYFRCSAVDTVEVGSKGDRLRVWRVRLFPGNEPSWLEPHLETLASNIREAREEAGYTPAPDRITINEPWPPVMRHSDDEQDGELTEAVTLEMVLQKIREVERFNVRILRDGRQVRGDFTRGLDHYKYAYALDGDRTVNDWKLGRFLPNYEAFGSDDYRIEVYDDSGNIYAGQSKLRNVRD